MLTTEFANSLFRVRQFHCFVGLCGAAGRLSGPMTEKICPATESQSVSQQGMEEGGREAARPVG